MFRKYLRNAGPIFHSAIRLMNSLRGFVNQKGSIFTWGWRLRASFPAVVLFVVACTVRSPQIHEVDARNITYQNVPLKVHLRSGDLVVYDRWAEDSAGKRYHGSGLRYDRDRRLSKSGIIEISVDSVALLETSRDKPGFGYFLGTTLLASYTVVTGIITVSCLADPKSCFGSCPTFYLESGDSDRPAAEGFSSSVARVLEETDVDDLRATVSAGPVFIRMRNEALETHAVRSLRLHALPESSGSRVFATAEGSFRVATRLLEPASCLASEGDCLERTTTMDGKERTSKTDSTDLSVREIMELEFPPTAGSVPLGLVIAARNTFVSTFLFYQTLSYLGSKTGDFLASLERNEGNLADRVRKSMSLLGDIKVSMQGADGEWRPAGGFSEAGPIAADVHLLELQPRTGKEPLRVRLNMTRGFWRLDYVALAELGGSIESVLLPPVSVARVEGSKAVTDDPSALQSLLNPDRYLVTGPGDHYRIEFRIPGQDHMNLAIGKGRYRLFLESRGYYYEWMRREWLKEESPELATRMFFQPTVMFRALAPDFKAREAAMEKTFWSSRFRR